MQIIKNVCFNADTQFRKNPVIFTFENNIFPLNVINHWKENQQSEIVNYFIST